MEINSRDGVKWTNILRATVVATLVSMIAGNMSHGAPAEFRLTALPAPSGLDTSTSVPASQTSFDVGVSVYVEVWVQTTEIDGLSSASLDISFNPTRATAVAITPSPVLSELQHGTIDNAAGRIDDLSGSHLGPCSDAVAVFPKWTLVAGVELTTEAGGTLPISALPTGSPVYGTAICGTGDIDPANITYGSVNLIVRHVPVPATSAWTLAVMGALVMVAGTLVIRQRRPVQCRSHLIKGGEEAQWQ